MANYLHDDNKNRVLGMSQEQIYALLAEAIQEGRLPVLPQDTAFVTMIKSVIDGKAYKQAFCTEAKYNELEALGQLQADTIYYITDDTSYDSLLASIESISDRETSNEDDIADAQQSITTLQQQLQQSITLLDQLIKSYENPLVECSSTNESKTITTDFTVPQIVGYGLYIKFDYYGAQSTWNVMTLTINDGSPLPLCVNGSPITSNDTPIFDNGDTVRVVYAQSDVLQTYCWNITANITQGERF